MVANIKQKILVERDKQMRALDKELSRYSGDLPSNTLQQRTKAREDKNREISSYDGDILVKTIRKREKAARVRGKEIANFSGDIELRRALKGSHPSAVYLNQRGRNKYKARERYQKRMIKKYHRQNNIDDPDRDYEHEKPDYDRREFHLWND